MKLLRPKMQIGLALTLVATVNLSGCGGYVFEDFVSGSQGNILVQAAAAARSNNITQAQKDRARAAADLAKTATCDAAAEYRRLAEEAAVRAEVQAPGAQRLADWTQDAYDKNTQLHVFSARLGDLVSAFHSMPDVADHQEQHDPGVRGVSRPALRHRP